MEKSRGPNGGQKKKRRVGASNILRAFITSERAGDCRFSIFAMGPMSATRLPRRAGNGILDGRIAFALRERAREQCEISALNLLGISDLPFIEWKILTLISVVRRRERFQKVSADIA